MSALKVFVTVGTTQFDALIKAAVDDRVLETLHDKGYREMTLQIGRGDATPPDGIKNGLSISHFRLKPSIALEFSSADLVISHAGAGSCLEALEARKPLIAVVNEALMDNHQRELAQELTDNGYCFYCHSDTLQETIAGMDVTKLKSYERGKPGLLAEYLDSVIKIG